VGKIYQVVKPRRQADALARLAAETRGKGFCPLVELVEITELALRNWST